jgi:plastocyanin
MKRLFLLLAATLFAFGCTEPANDTAFSANKNTGRIHGFVRLKGSLPAPSFESPKENQDICGHLVPLQRIVLGKENGVQDTFVYLDGVEEGRRFPKPSSVLVDQKRCAYAPHVMIVPAGTKLEITNSDPILHNVHGLQMTDDGMQTIFNIAQPVRGQRTTIEQALMKPGIVYLACEAGHAWMNAYVFVASHPYVKVTDQAGAFVMTNVPSGKYRIRMWHEGVTRRRNIESLQRYDYEQPYELTQDVVVQAGADSVINFELSLRPLT